MNINYSLSNKSNLRGCNVIFGTLYLNRARLLKGIITYPVDNFNFINMISQ